MTPQNDPYDPKGLIRESYRIEGIGSAECRSIFLDWALALPEEIETADAVQELLARHAGDAADHPMTAVLREGQGAPTRPRRRGGWRARDRG